MAMEFNPQSQNKKRRRSAWFLPMVVLAILGFTVIILSLFYRVREIEVINGTDYADGQIIEASGIELGANLFFINRFESASRVFSSLPYVEALTIEQEAPSKIILQVQGSSPVGYVELDGEYWLLDRRGKVLEKITQEKAKGFVFIRNLTPISPIPGEPMVSDEAGMVQLYYALAILDSLTAENLIGKVAWVDMNNVNDPVMSFDNRLTVYLGSNEEIPYKFALFADAVAKLSVNDRGTLRYAGGSAWSYSPD